MKLRPRTLHEFISDLSRRFWSSGASRSRRLSRSDRARVLGQALVLEALEGRQLFSTYYVSTVGDDYADGSALNPFLTLQKAANAVVAGDTVIVRAGTYASGFVLGWDDSHGGK